MIPITFKQAHKTITLECPLPDCESIGQGLYRFTLNKTLTARLFAHLTPHKKIQVVDGKRIEQTFDTFTGIVTYKPTARITLSDFPLFYEHLGTSKRLDRFAVAGHVVRFWRNPVRARCSFPVQRSAFAKASHKHCGAAALLPLELCLPHLGAFVTFRAIQRERATGRVAPGDDLLEEMKMS